MIKQLKTMLLASVSAIILTTDHHAWAGEARHYAPPPSDFPIESAGPQDLRLLGLPNDLVDHPKIVRALHDPRLHQPPPAEGLPAMRMRPHMRAGETGRGGETGHASSFSSNWSGQVNSLHIPSDSATLELEIIASACTSHDGDADFAAFWGGFDGWGNNDVLQAGILCSSTFGYAAWFEYFPDFLTNLFKVRDGADVLIAVWHTSTAPHGHAIVYDATDGGYSNVAFDCTSCNGSDPWTGTNISWIAEAPEVNGKIATMSDYHRAVMIDSAYFPRGPGGMSSANTNIVMVQGGISVSVCATPSKYTMVCGAY